MDTLKQKTNSTLVYTGTTLFVINIIALLFLVYFDMLRTASFGTILGLLAVSVTSVVVSAYWYSHDEKRNQGTIIPLVAILLSFYLVTQEWNEFKTVDRPSSGIDGKKISGFD